MLAYTDAEKQKIMSDSSHKELLITFLDDDTFESIGNDRIYQESLTLVESLCDDENLRFGECESAELKIQVADVTEDIKGHEIQLDLTVGGVFIPLGIFYIANVEKATDKRYKKLTCYDRMYYMNSNVISWYNALYPTVDTTHTLKEFRDTFFEYMGIEQVETALVNDDIVVYKTIDAQELSGHEVVRCICEINGVFGHINRYGQFEYKELKNTGLYPSPTLYPSKSLYPSSGNSETLNKTMYIPPSERADYQVKRINKLQVRSDDGDIGAIVTSDNYTDDTNNSYIITGNFLVYGNDAETLDTIAQNVAVKIFAVKQYTPNSTNLVALPYVEVGDAYTIKGLKESFNSFVLKRTLSGIQGMKDLWETYGNEYQPEIVEGANQEIIQLRSRVNVLTRTVDETRSQITRVETDLTGQITTLNTDVKQTAEVLSAEIKRATGKETELSTQISMTAEGLRVEVSNTYETKADALAYKTSVNSTFEQTFNAINLKVSSDNVINSINLSTEGVTIDANKINLKGYVTITDLSGNGTVTIDGGRIDTETLFSRDIIATNFKLVGNSTLQVGASGVENNNYLFLVGRENGTLAETGLMHNQVYTARGTDSASMAPDSFGLNRKTDSGTASIFAVSMTNDNYAQIGSVNGVRWGCNQELNTGNDIIYSHSSGYFIFYKKLVDKLIEKGYVTANELN